MIIAIGNDHIAVDMKKIIKAHLEKKGIEVIDIGTHTSERFHYPIAARAAAKLITDGEASGAVLICGTGVGISIAANKVRGIRACVCSEPYSARMAKEHNDANVIAFGARVVGEEVAKTIVDAWLDASYEGGRHQERLDMINEMES
jgi:ribose 5-phosphate isomerase B